MAAARRRKPRTKAGRKCAETWRLKRLLETESGLWTSGLRHVAGVDEVGRGPLAGPVVVLGILGLAGAGRWIGVTAFAFVTGIALMVSLFARDQNWYWATLALPTIAAGLALAPRAVLDLLHSLRRPGVQGTSGVHG